MKKIWLIAPFAGIEEASYRNRFLYLSKMLKENNYDVTLITSNFSHFSKQYVDENTINYPFRVVMLFENGYKKNVSISRIKSHLKFSLELKKWLYNQNDKPDLIYVAYPTMSAAKISNNYAKKYNLPIILDVQDTWPESISAAIDINKVRYRLAIYPLTLLANKIYREADAVIAVSNTYLKRAMVTGSRSKFYECVYIGSELEKFNQVQVHDLQKPQDEIWITYIGTLSHSYDLKTAILAIKKLSKNFNVILNILGDGPDYDYLYDLAKKEGVLNKSVFFKGFLKYEDMVVYLKLSDIALNAIHSNSKATITNKFGDYLAAGLPILNCCEEEEVKNLITSECLGMHYNSGNILSLVTVSKELIQNVDFREKASLNAFKIAQMKFNRKNSYQPILNIIAEVLK